MTRVVVLTGGATPEREVALAGAAQVVRALRDAGYRVDVVDTVEGLLDAGGERRLLGSGVGRAPPTAAELERLRARELGVGLLDVPAIQSCDAVFVVLHGREGEGGSIQALLDAAGIPYTGSGPLGSMLAMDKDLAKRLFRQAAVPTPPWAMWPVDRTGLAQLGLPVIVKPSKAGSTVGLSLVERWEGVPRAVEEALSVDDEVLLERYLPGRELTVGILGETALAVGEIVPAHTLFDYECKYTPGLAREIFPADLPPELTRRIQDLGLAAHRALKLRDFSRVDFRLDEHGAPQCLEVNTLPGFTTTSLLPQSAAAAGIPFTELCERIIGMALRRAAARNKVKVEGN